MNFTVTSIAVSVAEQGAAVLAACAVLCSALARTVATRGGDKAWRGDAAQSSLPINLLYSNLGTGQPAEQPDARVSRQPVR
jgi:hypothetical protein